MRQRMVIAGLMLAAGIGLAAGCAGPTAGSSASRPDAPGPAAADGISGTWRGSFGLVGASLYTVEGDCVVEIKEDGTFSARIGVRSASNNLAKPSTWSGTVVRRGDWVTFRTPGPSVTLVRRGNTLYGVASDPFTEETVMIRLDRAGR